MTYSQMNIYFFHADQSFECTNPAIQALITLKNDVKQQALSWQYQELEISL
jgi:hypothetical protein